MARLKQVAKNLTFSKDALINYVANNLGIKAKHCIVQQYEGGQSNPTYLVELNDQKYVLRRKPPGVLLPSAHAVEREFMVMKCLADTNVPVPEMLILCEDADVIGTPFYLMKHVEGRVFEQSYAEDVTPVERRQIFFELIRVLANLHRVDFEKIGLKEYGKTQDYVARQISRWSKQYIASQTSSIPAMDKLIEALPQRLPKSGPAGIVHGDYRLGNVIFHPCTRSVQIGQILGPR